MTQLSPEAARCRREYQNAYWERKAQQQTADTILEDVPEVEHAEPSEDTAQYIAHLEKEVKDLTRRCGVLSRQIRAYQTIIGNAILAAQEKDSVVIKEVQLNEIA